jgi:hypothetical protein
MHEKLIPNLETNSVTVVVKASYHVTHKYVEHNKWSPITIMTHNTSFQYLTFRRRATPYGDL